MSTLQKVQTEIPEKNKYIHINDYNKLHSKYEIKNKENKKLRECIDNLMQSYDSIKDNKKAVEEMFSVMKDLIKTNKNFFKPKEEFSTSTSSYEYIVVDNINNLKSSSKSCNSSNFNYLNSNQIVKINSNHNISNLNLIKKIDDIENSYNEILRNFEDLVMKYKIIKEEKNKVDDHNIILLDQIGNLNNEYNNILAELNDSHVTIERFKEIDKCILDSSINSLFLNSNEKKKTIVKDENNKIVNNPYILCEPVPTFVKFINKYTK